MTHDSNNADEGPDKKLAKLIIDPVCSNKPKPRVQRGAKGHAGWNRDTYHAMSHHSNKGWFTLCGRRASDWLLMDPMPASQALKDLNFCTVCARILKSDQV